MVTLAERADSTGPLDTIHDHRAIQQGSGVKGVWIPPAPQLILGDVKEWAALANVEALSIPGYWYDREGSDVPIEAPPGPTEKVILNFHGGGYVGQSAHPGNFISVIVREVMNHAPPNVLRSVSVEYRLLKLPTETRTNPFPAALVDAIAGYNYLVNVVCFRPENIIILGDSAGGNMALALIRHLLEIQQAGHKNAPGPPGGLILCSPWVDLGPPSSDSSSSMTTNFASDIVDLTNSNFELLRSIFVGPLGSDAAISNHYISPVSSSSQSTDIISYRGYPRIFILCGGAEVMRDDIRSLRKKMEADLGTDMVTYVEPPDAIHDFLIWPWYEPEWTESLRLIRDWIALGC